MKFTVLILLFLVICQITCKHSRKQEEEEEEGEAGDDAGVSQDTLMEYRVLGSGTFSIKNSNIDAETGTSSWDTLEEDWIQFPNYCKSQLDELQFVSLSAKASVYLDCWYDATGVESIEECPDAMALCASGLLEYEAKVLEGEEGDEEEGDEEEGDEEEGDEEEGDEEEGDEEEGDDEEEESEDEEVSDEEAIFIHEEVPYLDAVQIACFYSSITKNLDAQVGTLESEDALDEANIDGIFSAVTFDALQRTQVSWLEFWLFMCNGDQNIQKKFDENPLLLGSNEALALYEKLNPVEEEGDEEEAAEERKVKKVSNKLRKNF